MSRVPQVWLLLIAVISAVACRDRAMGADSGAARAPASLDGTWEIELHLERPVVLVARDTNPPRDVRGCFVFVRNHSLRQRYPTIGVPDYHGTYEIDFAAFGFDPSARHELPSAIAALSGEDSVIIALNPTNADMTVMLRGSMSGDSVGGTWTVSSRRVGGGGSFVLRRAIRTSPASQSPIQ